MRILFILDNVENPTSANVLMAQRLAGVLCAAGHTVHLLELWDGLHPQPELPGCTVHCLAFADERLMNAALENGRSGGSPIPVRLARLCCHPTGGGGGVPPAGAARPAPGGGYPPGAGKAGCCVPF